MLNGSFKLNPKLFDKNVERESMRVGFGEGLVELGAMSPRVVALCADLTESVQFSHFKKTFPERFVELGVAEQNMASVASGMASMGKIPFISSYATFSPGRNWEQIRTTICYNNVPVKIVGSHVGVSVGPDGGSHQALEDIALMRALPRMTVLSPADITEARMAVRAAMKIDGPVYIRLARNPTPNIFTGKSPLPSKNAMVLWAPPKKKKSDVAIIATGTVLYEALKAAKELEKKEIYVTVLNIFSIKPLDGGMIGRLAKEAGAMVVCEEHQQAGGLGGAVAEFLSRKLPTPIEFIGVKDEFGQSGTIDELFKHYHLTSDDIVEAAEKVIARKSKL